MTNRSALVDKYLKHKGPLHAECQQVKNGLVNLCDNLRSKSSPELIKTCQLCQRFYMTCCKCSAVSGHICKHFPLVLVASAICEDSSAGLGILIGSDESKHAWPVVIDEAMIGNGKVSKDRCDLLAIIEGLKKLRKREKQDQSVLKGDPNHGLRKREWVIGVESNTISKYLNNFPKWKENKFKCSHGKTPANLDLYQRLDKVLKDAEITYGVKIGFWIIPSRSNPAQILAKEASFAHRAGTSQKIRKPLQFVVTVPASSLRKVESRSSASSDLSDDGKGKARLYTD